MRVRDCALSLPLSHLGLSLRAMSRLPSAAEEETLTVLQRSVGLGQLPTLDPIPQGETLRSLSMACNALVLLNAPPQRELLELLRNMDLESLRCSSQHSERRAGCKLVDALHRWDAAVLAEPGRGGRGIRAVPVVSMSGALPVPAISASCKQEMELERPHTVAPTPALCAPLSGRIHCMPADARRRQAKSQPLTVRKWWVYSVLVLGSPVAALAGLVR
eukprot:CAMPEP_0181187270 /NCGR_PEP_ID=MMETSP1096-20121128/10480_1 /TAXON_ID=156174 ORGANISM="Chrysochromulina ericina, Strain CCMP281" /NCGR_SAMPLE_ID=MMETSP1096 /ASSEMBLY_ACC=CAM_ASM_000453 /LENGTH=217 /DNA_ID=CAMNT_0023276227 /DNA_START=22 /DNA_END=673 /DNA_ORIENTATION=+